MYYVCNTVSIVMSVLLGAILFYKGFLPMTKRFLANKKSDTRQTIIYI